MPDETFDLKSTWFEGPSPGSLDQATDKEAVILPKPEVKSLH